MPLHQWGGVSSLNERERSIFFLFRSSSAVVVSHLQTFCLAFKHCFCKTTAYCHKSHFPRFFQKNILNTHNPSFRFL